MRIGSSRGSGNEFEIKPSDLDESFIFCTGERLSTSSSTFAVLVSGP